VTAVIEQSVMPEAAFQDAAAAAAEWSLVAPVMAGEVFPGRMRVVDSSGNYGWKRRKPLAQTPPPRPAAVELFDSSSAMARVLPIDIDATVVGARVAAEHAAAVAQILRMAGMHPWIDASETGGRHVIARLPHPVAQKDLAALVRALRERYPSVDTAPVSGVQGCLRPTGSRHARGGWQRHVGTIDQLQAAVTTPPATDSWRRLCAQLPPPEQAPTDVPVQRALPGTRLTGEAIGDILHRQAVDGPAKAIHAADQSRFRYRVERTAVEAGFTEDEYVHAVITEWPWMKSSYARKGRPEKVAADHYGYASRKPKKKHTPQARGKSFSQNVDTSHPNNPRPPAAPTDLTIRKWLTHGRRQARANQLTAHERWLVTVLAFFALSKNSLRLDAGLRAYALGCGLSHENVRNGLARLFELGLVHRVERGRARKADVWELVTDHVHDDSPAPGWIQGLRSAFVELGPMAGEIYELLITEGNPARGRRRRKRPTGKGIPQSAALSTAEIAMRTGYSPSAVKDALAALTAWDLATLVPRRNNRPSGWIAGKADPNRVAALLGTDEAFEYRRQMYARQRARWWAWLGGFRHRHTTLEPTLSLFDLDIAATAPPDDAWLTDLVDVPPWERETKPADTA
jgi:DNA-binding transcriptional ArsR family regulator